MAASARPRALEFNLLCVKRRSFYIEIGIMESPEGYQIQMNKHRHPEDSAELRLDLYTEEEHFHTEENVLSFRIRCHNRYGFFISLRINYDASVMGDIQRVQRAPYIENDVTILQDISRKRKSD